MVEEQEPELVDRPHRVDASQGRATVSRRRRLVAAVAAVLALVGGGVVGASPVNEGDTNGQAGGEDDSPYMQNRAITVAQADKGPRAERKRRRKPHGLAADPRPPHQRP